MLKYLKWLNDAVIAAVAASLLFGWWFGYIVIAKMTDHLYVIHIN